MSCARLDTNGAAAAGGAGGQGQPGGQEDREEGRERTIGDGQVQSSEGESRMNEDLNNGHGNQPLTAEQPTLQKQLVCWERFLPLRSLKVLLVENDDSTRHVVSALLRNCGYEVTAVANGLEAWTILKDLTHIDLVLTEVAMPSLSGIGLLSKIMNHKTCSNIPVIMMSSNDSMGIVFTCLSKGATDFLVKPIRKNEIKNLWQHVWRKCHSSSGSWSESGIRAHKSTKSKSVEGLKNEMDSNNEDDNGSIGLNVGDGSDDGSGTQSSWSKRAVEFDSLQPTLPWNEVVDPSDSTSAEAIYSTPEALQSLNATRSAQNLNNEQDDVMLCKLKDGTSRNLDLQLHGHSNSIKDKPFRLETKENENKLGRGKVDLNYEAMTNELLNKGAGVRGGTFNITLPLVDNIGNEVANHPSRNFSNGMAADDPKQVPSLELSLKQNQDASDIGICAYRCNTPRQSGPSAFSRYTKSKITNPAPTGNVGSCSLDDNSSEAAKIDSMHNFISSSSGTPNAPSNRSSDNNDMGSTTASVFTRPEGDRSMPKSTANIHHHSAFQRVQSISSPQPLSATQASGTNHDIQVQEQHHFYHHHYYHNLNDLPQQPQLNQNLKPDGLSSMKMTIEGNVANYGSASGSNNGSGQNGGRGQNRISPAMVAEQTNLTNEKEVVTCRGCGGIGCGSTSLFELNARKAALCKFQRKRKERLLQNRCNYNYNLSNADHLYSLLQVRYETRKKIALQRPRVKGQFV